MAVSINGKHILPTFCYSLSRNPQLQQFCFFEMEVSVNLNLDNLVELHELDLAIRQLDSRLDVNSAECEQIEKRPKDYMFDYSENLELLKKQADEITNELKKLNNRREKMVKALPVTIAGLYERIKARHSFALADAGSGCCQGCHMTIRYILLKKVRRAEQITTCENCGRILYCKPVSLSRKIKESEVEKRAVAK
jgi:hypothetical protein